jgi:SAM-dependent methyltransferase
VDRWVNRSQGAHWQKRRSYRSPDSLAARAFAVPKLEWLCRHLDITSESSVLDVGAGNGMFTYWWTHCAGEVVGIELSSNMIDRSPVRDRLLRGDVLNLPFADNSFDVVFAGNLLHHLVQPENALREMARVSRGGVAICEGNRNHPPMAAFGVSSRVCRGLLSYSRRTLGDLVLTSGIDVVGVTSQGYVYENHSPEFSLPISRALEQKLRGGAYLLLAGHTKAPT